MLDKPSEGWIRDALLSGFNVTCKSICESRVSGNRDDQVVPAGGLIQGQLAFGLLLGLEKPLDRVAAIGIQHADFSSNAANIGDLQLD